MGAGRTCDHLFGFLFWVAQGHVPVLCRSVEIASCGCCKGGGVARFWLGRDPASLAGKGGGGRERIWKRQSRKGRGNLARCSTALDPRLCQHWAGIGQKRVVQARNAERECERELHRFRGLFVKKTGKESGRASMIDCKVGPGMILPGHNNAGRGKAPPHPHSAGFPLWDDALTST